MPKQEEVEKYKITPEMKGFMKAYKAHKMIGDRLRGEMQIHLDEASRTRQMLEQVEKGMQMLTLNAPEKPTFEVPGEEEETQTQEINPQIQY